MLPINDEMTSLDDPDRRFALIHAPTERRESLAAVWALDEVLGRIVATTSQPMVGQMRLTWWHNALNLLTSEARQGEPVLDALARQPIADGAVAGADLAVLVKGWEHMLDPLPLDSDALDAYAKARGGQLFTISGRILGRTLADLADAGTGWALADFACRCTDVITASRAFDLAAGVLATVDTHTLPRPLRILTRLAIRDIRARRRTTRTPWALLRAL